MVNLSDVHAKSTLSRGDQCYPEKGRHFLLRLLTKMLKYCRKSREVSQKCVSKYSCGEKQEQKCLFKFPVHLRYKYYYYFHSVQRSCLASFKWAYSASGQPEPVRVVAFLLPVVALCIHEPWSFERYEVIPNIP